MIADHGLQLVQHLAVFLLGLGAYDPGALALLVDRFLDRLGHVDELYGLVAGDCGSSREQQGGTEDTKEKRTNTASNVSRHGRSP
jgi:hypothetical protein